MVTARYGVIIRSTMVINQALVQSTGFISSDEKDKNPRLVITALS